MEIPTVLSKAEHSTNAQQRRNLVQEYERKFEQVSEDQKLSKLCSDAGLKLVEKDNTSILLKRKMDNRCNIYAENARCLAMKKGTRVRGWLRKNTRIGPVLNMKVCYRDEQLASDSLLFWPFVYSTNHMGCLFCAEVVSAVGDRAREHCHQRIVRSTFDI